MPHQLQVARTAAVCATAELQGDISVGEHCAVHPGACIRAAGGPIVLGERCFVEDGAVLASDGPDGLHVGSGNLFESGSDVRSARVGDGNWFEPKAQARAGSVIGSNCLIGSGVVVAAGEPLVGAEEVEASDDPVLWFPVLFDAIVNRSVVLEHLPETHDLRVRSIAEEEVAEEVMEVEVEVEASTAQDAVLPPSLQPTDRLVRVDGHDISVLSFQDVIDSPVGSVAVLPLFKPVDSVHVLSGFARVEILSPKMLEFEPATPEREEVVVEWVEEKARLKAEQEAREREIANNKELQERLEQERRVAEALAKKESDLLEKLDKEEYERTRMTPHNLASGKRRDGWEFRYEVEFTTKGPIGLNWDLNTRDKAVVSHLEPKLPANELNVIAPRDQLIALNGVDTSKMGPQEVVEVYLSSAIPRKLVFLVQMSAERAAAKAAEKPINRPVMNWTLTFDAPEMLRGWEVRLHLATWSYRGACTLIDKANHAHAANGKALLIVNNVKGDVHCVPCRMGKLDGELIMSVMEHQEALIRIYRERPDQIPVPVEQPAKLTNQELTIAKDVKKAGRKLTFWYINESMTVADSNEETGSSPSVSMSFEFQVLPALFGGKIPTMPFRIVAAYPQEMACNYKGLGILATRSVVVVKRGGCSFGAKLR
uniref:Dynactin subunit 6 n=1 Tax=Phytophthora ramorum TaxID=164328 RepID=H3HED2_PHYRM